MRHQQAARVVACAFGRAAHARLRVDPCRVVVSGRFPSPRIDRCIDLFAGTGGIIAVDAGHVRSVGVVAAAQPAIVRIDGFFGRRVALYDQPGLVETDLRDRFHFCKIPYDGGQRVFAGFQPPGQVDRFEVPVEHVAAGRTDRGQFAVDIQFVTIVRRYVNDKTAGFFGQFERFPEVVDAVGVLRLSGDGDPLGRPAPVEPASVDIGLAVARQVDLRRCRSSEQAQGETGQQVDSFHRFGSFSG